MKRYGVKYSYTISDVVSVTMATGYGSRAPVSVRTDGRTHVSTFSEHAASVARVGRHVAVGVTTHCDDVTTHNDDVTTHGDDGVVSCGGRRASQRH